MRLAGLQGVSGHRGFILSTRQRDTGQDKVQDPIKPRVTAERPDQRWVVDIINIPT